MKMFEKIFNRIKLFSCKIREEKSLHPVLKEISLLTWIILRFYSLKLATKEQKLVPIMLQLGKIVSDYKDQYSYSKIEGGFWNYKVCAHHTFQVRLANEGIKSFFSINKKECITIVDTETLPELM